MNKFKAVIGVLWAMSVAMMIGCVEEFDAGVKGMPAEGLVVEGNIVSDSAVVFQLSKTMPLTNSNEALGNLGAYMSVNANVKVKGSDGTNWEAEPKGQGRYLVEIGTLQPNVEYHLEIEYDGDVYRSEPQKPLETSGIESVSFQQPDLLGPVSILLDTPENINGEKKYYLWYFEEDWEVRAEFASKFLYDPSTDKTTTYDYPPVAQGWCHVGLDQIMLGSTEAYAENRVTGKILKTIPNSDHRLSVLYSIRIEQRDLTRKEYEYYQERSKQNNEMGGLFTPQPSELPTNITCSNSARKVIGFVGCNMGVTRKHLYISNDEVGYLNKFDCRVGQDPQGSNKDKYSAGFQISNIMVEGNNVYVEWAMRECVDVTMKKADPKGRPSWWPNPYLTYEE